MWAYITTVVLCVCLWKVLTALGKALTFYTAIYKCLSHFPLPIGNHWFFGIAHLARDSEEYMQIVQMTVDKLQPKAIALWITWLRPGLSVVHPDTMKAVLKASHVSVPKSREYRFLNPWIGDGLLVSGGKKWERSRRLLTPAFHFDVLKPYVQIYNDVAELFLSKIKSLTADGNSVDICPIISRATLDTVLRCALSYVDKDVQTTDKRQHPFCENINKVKDIIGRRWMNPLIHSDFVFALTSDGKDMKNCCKYLHEFSCNLIKLRRQALEDDPSLLKKRHLDFLDILLSARDDSGEGLTDQEIRDEVDTFMFAGHDTTASAMMWTLYALAKYPKMQQEVRDELNDILAEKSSVEYDDLPKLQFTTRFLKESLRMFSPVPAVNRRLAEPVTIEGVTFPAETVIDILPYSLHHNPAVWENHNEFDPDRFLTERFAEKDPFSFLPFSAGQRNCIGQHFAMNEIKVVVTQAVRRFEISLDNDKPALMYRDFVTSAKNGIYLYFKDM